MKRNNKYIAKLRGAPVGYKEIDFKYEIDTRILSKVLIDPDTKKDDAMKLAEWLLDRYYSDNQFIRIAIFDDIDTARYFNNNDNLETKLDKHYLILVTASKNTGYKNIKWMKKE